MNDYLKKQKEDAKKHPWQWVGLIAVVALIFWLAACSTKDDEEDWLAEVEATVEEDERRAK